MVMGVLSLLFDGALGEHLLEAWRGPVLETLTVKTWYAVGMKVGFAKTAGAVVALAGLAQAQCPDYTTFSQVCTTIHKFCATTLM